MVYLVRDMRRTRAAKEEIEEAEGAVAGIVKAPSWRFPLMLVAGLVGLVVGALLVIKGTKAVLHWSGIEETILGLTLLAIAANSVELVEAIIPAKQGHPEVVIGNVAGSSFFQLLFTLGICALINPLQVNQTAITYFFPAVAMSWLILLLLVWHRRPSLWVGLGLMTLYGLFVVGAVMMGMSV